MEIKAYKTAKSTHLRYTFVSKSAEKSILKSVIFQQIESSIYNVALLDYIVKTKTWDDMSNPCKTSI